MFRVSITRRRALRLLGVVAGAVATAGTSACARSENEGASLASPATSPDSTPPTAAASEPDATPTTPPTPADPSRLTARPGRQSPRRTPEPGLSRLGLGSGRDGLLYIPQRLQAPAPLVLVLHGAGGVSDRSVKALLPFADEAGLVLLAVDSRDRTWDAVLGGFGPDVAFIDQALRHAFATVAVDADRVWVEGFSDGASYALSLGLTNGDLFRAIVAFSPGFSAAEQTQGKPRIFVSHGTTDGVLPIGVTSHRLVPRLREAGYTVEFVEFDGGHDVPRDIAEQAVQWLTEDVS